MKTKTVTYKLTGKRNRQGSSGKPERFVTVVSRHKDTSTPLQAMESVRELMYRAGFDCILFKACYIRKGRRWAEIPMMEALGLE